MFKVIAGKYRHRLLETPSTNTIPSMGKVKEAIFSALSFSLINKKVLDLFAGSGALGIEALSRGALEATFIDNNFEAIKCINKNIYSLGITNAHVFQSDVISYLNNTTEKFDIILLDPPYDKTFLYEETIKLIFKNDILSECGILVIECKNIIDMDKYNINYQRIKIYKHGIANIIIIWK